MDRSSVQEPLTIRSKAGIEASLMVSPHWAAEVTAVRGKPSGGPKTGAGEVTATEA
ncbi:hypothetical protein FOQG_14177 [Fusarium oxysporum f. sp. raphani 54005]|uniref:Uncharacterized protein n=3 Tax=Fusarium oxysporum TaxID=5507 RepID=X0BSH5_FUSOX|nr:hypothetical protein FOVG_04827 [Fusarium oxysporum f. sp. pisi HDV247]EXK81439.1 hypothetical protein FOQG_14177 [Fusarium oxysporum f. sp. raphani 54005]EXL87353.1 hypothetical protein FOPG_01595 [Fusarium oxysporum f. sp. conglutinans race 2 54008]